MWLECKWHHYRGPSGFFKNIVCSEALSTLGTSWYGEYYSWLFCLRFRRGNIYHLFYQDGGPRALLILKGLCCPVSNVKADNLGTEVVLPPQVENYSLFVRHTQFICGPRRCKSLNPMCPTLPWFFCRMLITYNMYLPACLFSLQCFLPCHKEDLDFSKMHVYFCMSFL